MRLYPLLVVGLVLSGCEIDTSGSDEESGGAGGTANTGGTGGTSETANTGGTGGTSETASAGGSVGAGGSANTGGTAGNGGSGNETGASVVDPAPDRTEPGAYDCDQCPSSDITEFSLNLGAVTSNTFSGTVTGAVGNGEFYLEGEDGQSIAGVIPTDATTGAYSFTLPLFCGTQLLKCVWSNDNGEYVAVLELVTDECVDADIRITLNWDDLGSDFELHLIKDGGQINDDATDCTWTSCLGSGPDWGVVGDATDNPVKDVDDTGDFGPENIYYANPEDGIYTVMVEHWGSGAADADGQVTINIVDQTPTVIDITDLAPQFVFTAATIEWPGGRVVPVASQHDCTDNWSGGCRDEIP